MACGEVNDSELRDRLRQLGVSPGPITDSTRGLYQHKLWTLTQSTPQPAGIKTESAMPRTPPSPDSSSHPSPPVSACNDSPSSSRHSASCTSPSTHQRPHPPQQNTPQMIAANLALSVVEQMLTSFNRAAHLANDTVFIFPSGQLLFASRSMLVVQCPSITPLLYSKEDAFPVAVATYTGQSTEYYVRPSEYVVDLKEKISLAQGFPIAEQNLLFQQKSLINSTTLSSCGVSRGSELTLMSVGTSTTTTTTYFTSVLNPSLSIAHFTLGLRLDSLLTGRAPVPISPPHQAHRQPLPPHLSHIVHVHDVPCEGFHTLLVYLYSRQLMEPPNLNKVGVYVISYILGEFFQLPCLSRLCLGHIQSLLTVDSALALAPFAQTINCPPLYDLSVGYLKAHHTP